MLSALSTFVVILLIAGVALDKAFQQVIRSNIQTSLQAMTYSLLASTELSSVGTLRVPPQLPQSEITVPGSGMIAIIVNDKGEPVWKSPSGLGENVGKIEPLAPGHFSFNEEKLSDDAPFVFRFGSIWGTDEIPDQRFTFAFIQTKNDYRRQIRAFRKTVFDWFAGGAVLSLFIYFLVLLSELRPLKEITRELDNIERGLNKRISGHYPRELAQLGDGINTLIDKERLQQNRYRNALDDLAHSLKTPLAVIQSIDSEHKDHDRVLNEHVARMSDIISYQLKRAASAGAQSSTTPLVVVCPIITRTVATLKKVYADKNIQCKVNCDRSFSVGVDEGDLYEIIGNVSENAFKWANTKVHITCISSSNTEVRRSVIEIEDDGTGVSDAQKADITRRGIRADEQTPGQGIGLAVVKSITESYSGKLEVLDSDLGGAKFRLYFETRI